MNKKIIGLIALTTLLSPQNTQTQNNMNEMQIFVSKKTPNLGADTENIMEELQNTIWMTSDLQNTRELYVFFYDYKYGNISIKREENVRFPQQSYPMKFIQKGPYPNSSIFIIPSQEKILYYTFYLLTPYYMIISAGYNSIDPLLTMEIPDYLQDGHLLQLVY
ncbi:MAG: hypothetical protein ACRC0X_01450 [Brevinema sp.]